MKEFRPEFINPYTIIKDVLKSALFIILAAFVGLFGVRSYFKFTYKQEYKSTAIISISATESGYYTYSNLNKTIEAASTFQEMFQSTYFKEKLSDITGTPVTGTISASQIPETNLITLSYTCDSPVTAFKTLDATIKNYDTITDHTFSNMIINLISGPNVPTAPSNNINYNNYDYIAAFGLALIVLLLIMVISYFRDTVKNESDVGRLLDTKLFNVVYHEEKNKTLRSKLSFTHSREPLLITNILINYRFAESFRISALKLDYLITTKKIKTLMITSCGENEGKSTVAVNLALAMATAGKKVLLVDADLRKPAIHKFFTTSDEKRNGIGEIINGNISINNAIIKDNNTGLYVICGNQKYRNSSEMLSSSRVEKLIDSLKQQFDLIIFDTAPTSLVSDAEIMSGNIDNTLIVVRQDIAPVPEINDMIDVISQSGSEVIGCIFNDVHVLPGLGDKSTPIKADTKPMEEEGM